MVTKSKIDGTKGALSGLSFTDEETKNIPSKEVEKVGSKEEKKKRSYSLPESTIKRLSELKLYHYSTSTSLEDIVNEAILELYKKKNSKEV
jgi:hypothetical protein